jgi:GNAT superfamily N-acetyltransferase
MNANFNIVRASKSDMSYIMSLAMKQGWKPGKHDAHTFFKLDPNGFFLGKLKDKIIAMGSMVLYDATYAFSGLYMVLPEFQGLGYGLALTKARLAYAGDRTIGLDGVLNMVDKYARLGYQPHHEFIRFAFRESIQIERNPCIQTIQTTALDDICQYDKLHFPVARDAFLKYWLMQPESKTYIYLEHNQIRGYGLIRPCLDKGYRIGPLFADNQKIASILFENLVGFAKGQEVFLDIPEPNIFAQKLVKSYGMTEEFRVLRMYKGKAPKENLNQIYGNTTFEIG